MTKELEKTCEMIISKHKVNEGSLTWHKNTFTNVTSTTSAKEALIDLGLIKFTSSLKRTTTLTPRGWEFENFEIERNKYDPKLEKLRLEIESLRNQIFDYPKTKLQARIAILIAALSAIAAIIQLAIK